MYSLDFRKRVFEIKERDGLTFEQTAERFGVGIRTLFAWQKRLEPRTTRDKKATKVDMALLERDVKENPDAYQWERAKKLGVSQSAIFYALKRLGKTRKKNDVPPKGR